MLSWAKVKRGFEEGSWALALGSNLPLQVLFGHTFGSIQTLRALGLGSWCWIYMGFPEVSFKRMGVLLC